MKLNKTHLFLALLFVLPICINLFVLNKLGLNIPIFDDYRTYFSLDIALAKNNTFWQKWLAFTACVNEHELVVQRMVYLLVRKITGNVSFRLLQLLGTLSLLAAILVFWKKTDKKAMPELLWFVSLPLLFYNEVNYTNYLSAMTAMQNLLIIPLIVSTFYFLTSNRPHAMWASVVCAALSTYTSGHGMLLFPTGAVYLFFSKKYKPLLVWCVAGFACIALYFASYHTDISHSGLHATIASLQYILPHMLAFLGCCIPISAYSPIPETILGLLIVLPVAWLMYKKWNRVEPFWKLLAAFFFITAFIVVWARMASGQFIATRFKINSFVALAICIYMCMRYLDNSALKKIILSGYILFATANFLFSLKPYTDYRYWTDVNMALLINANNNMPEAYKHPRYYVFDINPYIKDSLIQREYPFPQQFSEKVSSKLKQARPANPATLYPGKAPYSFTYKSTKADFFNTHVYALLSSSDTFVLTPALARTDMRNPFTQKEVTQYFTIDTTHLKFNWHSYHLNVLVCNKHLEPVEVFGL